LDSFERLHPFMNINNPILPAIYKVKQFFNNCKYRLLIPILLINILYQTIELFLFHEPCFIDIKLTITDKKYPFKSVLYIYKIVNNIGLQFLQYLFRSLNNLFLNIFMLQFLNKLFVIDLTIKLFHKTEQNVDIFIIKTPRSHRLFKL